MSPCWSIVSVISVYHTDYAMSTVLLPSLHTRGSRPWPAIPLLR